MKRIVPFFVLILSVLAHAEQIKYEGEYLEQFQEAYQHYWVEDFNSAFLDFQVLAAKGDPTSQWFVGHMYKDGEAVGQDYAKAIKWFRASADGGFALAMSSLGWMHEKGQGFSKNYDEALKWYQLARDSGYGGAQADIDRVSIEIAASKRQASTTTASAPPPQTALERQAPIKSASPPPATAPLERQAPTDNARTSPAYRSESTGADRIAFKGLQGAVVGGFLALCAGLFLLIKAFTKEAVKAAKAAAPKMEELKMAAKKRGAALGNISKSTENRILEIDDEFFSRASAEIQQNNQVEGLWLKALALAEGNEEKQKAIYMRLRAKQLSDSAGD